MSKILFIILGRSLDLGQGLWEGLVESEVDTIDTPCMRGNNTS